MSIEKINQRLKEESIPDTDWINSAKARASKIKAAKDFLRTKELKLSKQMDGYIIPYAYLVTLLTDFKNEVSIETKEPYEEWMNEVKQRASSYMMLKSSVVNRAIKFGVQKHKYLCTHPISKEITQPNGLKKCTQCGAEEIK